MPKESELKYLEKLKDRIFGSKDRREFLKNWRRWKLARFDVFEVPLDNPRRKEIESIEV